MSRVKYEVGFTDSTAKPLNYFEFLQKLVVSRNSIQPYYYCEAADAGAAAVAVVVAVAAVVVAVAAAAVVVVVAAVAAADAVAGKLNEFVFEF